MKLLVAAFLLIVSVFVCQAQTKPKSTFEKPNGIFVALSVTDVEMLSKWYRDKLGFEIVTSGEAPNKIAKFAILRSEGAIIEMIQHRESKSRSEVFPASKGAHQNSRHLQGRPHSRRPRTAVSNLQAARGTHRLRRDAGEGCFSSIVHH